MDSLAQQNGSGPGATDGGYLDWLVAEQPQTVGGGAIPFSARGVRITARTPAPVLLPGFLNAGADSVAVAATARAAAVKATPLATMRLVIPVAVSLADFRAAFVETASPTPAAPPQYDLFQPLPDSVPLDPSMTNSPAFLDLTTASPVPGAPDCTADCAATDYAPPRRRNLQYWSDGQHQNGQLAAGAWVELFGPGNLQAEVRTGLRDNTDRQNLGSGGPSNPCGLLAVPVWDQFDGARGRWGSLRIVGFAMARLCKQGVTGNSAPVTFVPYPASAWGPADGQAGDSNDYGQRVVRLIP